MRLDEDEATHREDEVVSSPEDISEEESPTPHHLDEVVGHVKYLLGEVDAIGDEPEAVESQGTASVEGRLVDCHEDKVFDQKPRVFVFPQAPKEEVQHAVLLDVSLV